MRPLISHPVKKEFSAGHLGRVVRTNAGSPRKTPSYKLLKQLEWQAFGKISATPMQSLASLVGIPPNQYARQYMLLPFHSIAFNSESGASYGKWTYKRYCMVAMNPDAVLCKSCIADVHPCLPVSVAHEQHDGRRSPVEIPIDQHKRHHRYPDEYGLAQAQRPYSVVCNTSSALIPSSPAVSATVHQASRH